MNPFYGFVIHQVNVILTNNYIQKLDRDRELFLLIVTAEPCGQGRVMTPTLKRRAKLLTICGM